MGLYLLLLLSHLNEVIGISNNKCSEFSPSVPFKSKEDAQSYLINFETFDMCAFNGGNFVATHNKMYDRNVVFCEDDDTCLVGVGELLSGKQQMISYFHSGWFKLVEANYILRSYNDYSITFDTSITCEFSFPFKTLENYKGTYKMVTFGSILTFKSDGKINGNYLGEENDEQGSLGVFIRSLKNLFAKQRPFKTKTIAEHEASKAVFANDIDGRDHTINYHPQKNTIFGIDINIFIVISGISSIIVLIVVTIWILYTISICVCKKKNKYSSIYQTDVSDLDDNNSIIY
eukprot:128886_1